MEMPAARHEVAAKSASTSVGSAPSGTARGSISWWLAVLPARNHAGCSVTWVDNDRASLSSVIQPG
eukprot:scaffold128945_cov63-Phaeocystis_antarctica.AAC.3